jgi:hypothetical protein
MALTIAQLERQVEVDLDWRHAELAIFRELLTLDTVTQVRRSALFRGAWAILYAHYEGFCKYSLQLLADYLRELPNCDTLPHATFLFVHDKSMRAAKSLPTAAAFEFFRTTIDQLRLQPPPETLIETKSNLWPSLLDEILSSLDLLSYGVIDQPEKIKTLVARRNDIAHGQKVFIRDLSYYLEYENATRNLMYALALAIVDRAAKY